MQQRDPLAARLHPARPARPGEDAHPARARRFLDEAIPVVAGAPAQRRSAPAARRTDARRIVAERGRRHADRVARARGALPGEARDAGRDDRRSDRRHRSDQGRDARRSTTRTSAGHPLRHHPAHQPRHLRDQRAARPRAAHPGRPAQHPRGEGPPDPRLPGAHAARHAARVLGQPRGLHQPRQHHHAAPRPHRLADHHALSADDRRARHGDHRPGAVGGARRRRRSPWCRRSCAS